MLQELFALYAEHGKSLIDIGTHEAVLPIEIAKDNINLFERNNLIILGGDIYEKDINGKFKYIYETWSYDKMNLNESASEALRYFKFFSGDKRKLFVSIVVDYVNL